MSIEVVNDGSCWVAPDGTITWVGDSSHCGIAETVLKDETGGRMLERRGFIHCSYGYTDMGTVEGKPTQAQLDSLFDIAQGLRAKTDRVEYTGVAARIERFINKHTEVPA